MRNFLTAGLLLAGFSVAQAQVITPGIGGVAVTGQSGAGIYLPWNGGAVVGAPGVGSYNLNGGGYTSPYSWNQFSNPTAYNFNTGGFNYNSGVYGFNNGLTTSGYYGSPYGNVIQTGGYNSFPSNYGYSSYPSNYGYNSYPSNYGYNSYPYRGSSYGTGFGSSVTTPIIYTNTNGRVRGRGR